MLPITKVVPALAGAMALAFMVEYTIVSNFNRPIPGTFRPEHQHATARYLMCMVRRCLGDGVGGSGRFAPAPLVGHDTGS